jgi:hypothetical protein
VAPRKTREKLPPEGLVGAHRNRREASSSSGRQMRDPVGAGAEVAPTAKAERDQRARHKTEGSSKRIASRTPGKKGAPRRRSPSG